MHHHALNYAKSVALAGLLGLMLSAPVILPLYELGSAGESYKTTAGGERWWQHHLTWYRSMLATALFAPRALVADRAQFGLAFPYAYSPAFGCRTRSNGCSLQNRTVTSQRAYAVAVTAECRAVSAFFDLRFMKRRGKQGVG